MKPFFILWAVAIIAVGTTRVPASPVCQQQKFVFKTKRVVVKPIPDIAYSKADGSLFKLKSDKSQVTIYLPPEEEDRVFSFVKTKLKCEVGIGLAEEKEIEKGLMASFFPLAFVGKHDKYFSLVANISYALPFQPSDEHPLVVELWIKGES